MHTFWLFYIIQLKTRIDDSNLTQIAEQLMGKTFNFYKSCKDKIVWGQKSQTIKKLLLY